MPHDLNPDLLVAYLEGTATSAEAARVEAWTAADPENDRLVRALRAISREHDDAQLASEVDEVWRRVHAAIAAPSSGGAPPVRQLRLVPKRMSRWGGRLAASIALIAAAGMGTYWLRTQGAFQAVDLGETHEIVTHDREMRRLSLPDGSVVTLAPGSTLRYTAAFGRSERRVTLAGRAYFQVAHDETKPFLVHAHNVDTRVLGTEFAVEAYPADSIVDVAVRSGRVAVSGAAGAEPLAILGQGNGASVQRDGRAHLVRSIDSLQAFGWMEGALAFVSAPLPDVLEEFRRWYGLTVEVTDPVLRDQRITASYHRDKPQQALRLLAAALGARVVETPEQITLVR